MGRLKDDLASAANSNADPKVLKTQEYKEVLAKMSTTKKSVCGDSCICEDKDSELVLRLGQNDFVAPTTTSAPYEESKEVV